MTCRLGFPAREVAFDTRGDGLSSPWSMRRPGVPRDPRGSLPTCGACGREPHRVRQPEPPPHGEPRGRHGRGVHGARVRRGRPPLQPGESRVRPALAPRARGQRLYGAEPVDPRRLRARPRHRRHYVPLDPERRRCGVHPLRRRRGHRAVPPGVRLPHHGPRVDRAQGRPDEPVDAELPVGHRA
jgi:hypothetical protein